MLSSVPKVPYCIFLQLWPVWVMRRPVCCSTRRRSPVRSPPSRTWTMTRVWRQRPSTIRCANGSTNYRVSILMFCVVSDSPDGNSPRVALLLLKNWPQQTRQTCYAAARRAKAATDGMINQFNDPERANRAMKCNIYIYLVPVDNFSNLAAGQRSLRPHQGHGSVCTEQGAHHRHLPGNRGHSEPHHAGPGTGGYLSQSHLRYPVNDQINSWYKFGKNLFELSNLILTHTGVFHH